MVCVMLRLLEYYQGVLVCPTNAPNPNPDPKNTTTRAMLFHSDSPTARALVCVRVWQFLTSNRVEALDPAFQSRVQCALRYDALDVHARRQIWCNLLAARGGGGGGAVAGMAASEGGSLVRRPGGSVISSFEIDGSVIDVDALAAHALNGRQIKNCLQLALALARRDGTPLCQAHLDATLELSTAFAAAASGEAACGAAGGEGEGGVGGGGGGAKENESLGAAVGGLCAVAARCLKGDGAR